MKHSTLFVLLLLSLSCQGEPALPPIGPDPDPATGALQGTTVAAV